MPSIMAPLKVKEHRAALVDVKKPSSDGYDMKPLENPAEESHGNNPLKHSPRTEASDDSPVNESGAEPEALSDDDHSETLSDDDHEKTSALEHFVVQDSPENDSTEADDSEHQDSEDDTEPGEDSSGVFGDPFFQQNDSPDADAGDEINPEDQSEASSDDDQEEPSASLAEDTDVFEDDNPVKSSPRPEGNNDNRMNGSERNFFSPKDMAHLQQRQSWKKTKASLSPESEDAKVHVSPKILHAALASQKSFKLSKESKKNQAGIKAKKEEEETDNESDSDYSDDDMITVSYNPNNPDKQLSGPEKAKSGRKKKPTAKKAEEDIIDDESDSDYSDGDMITVSYDPGLEPLAEDEEKEGAEDEAKEDAEPKPTSSPDEPKPDHGPESQKITKSGDRRKKKVDKTSTEGSKQKEDADEPRPDTGPGPEKRKSGERRKKKVERTSSGAHEKDRRKKPDRTSSHRLERTTSKDKEGSSHEKEGSSHEKDGRKKVERTASAHHKEGRRRPERTSSGAHDKEGRKKVERTSSNPEKEGSKPRRKSTRKSVRPRSPSPKRSSSPTRASSNDKEVPTGLRRSITSPTRGSSPDRGTKSKSPSRSRRTATGEHVHDKESSSHGLRRTATAPVRGTRSTSPTRRSASPTRSSCRPRREAPKRHQSLRVPPRSSSHHEREGPPRREAPRRQQSARISRPQALRMPNRSSSHDETTGKLKKPMSRTLSNDHAAISEIRKKHRKPPSRTKSFDGEPGGELSLRRGSGHQRMPRRTLSHGNPAQRRPSMGQPGQRPGGLQARPPMLERARSARNVATSSRQLLKNNRQSLNQIQLSQVLQRVDVKDEEEQEDDVSLDEASAFSMSGSEEEEEKESEQVDIFDVKKAKKSGAFQRALAMQKMKSKRNKSLSLNASFRTCNNTMEKDASVPEHLNLLIEVVRARNILIGDTTTSDPYVLVYLGEKKIHKTAKIMKTLNPNWGPNERSQFILSCPTQELMDKGLTFKMNDWDLIGGDDPLGHFTVKAKDLLEKNEYHRNYCITPPKGQEGEDAGIMTLRWRPAERADLNSLKNNERKSLFALTADDTSMLEYSNLLIEVVRARNILIGDTTTSDPYVIIYQGEKKIHKTGKIMKTLNPDWGPEQRSQFILSCPTRDLMDTGLTFKMNDWDLIGSDDPLGHITLTGPELLLEKGQLRNFTIIPPKGQEDEDAGIMTIRCRKATTADFDSLKNNEKKDLFIGDSTNKAGPALAMEHLNLLIEIVRARNILIGDTTTSDPYVLAYLGDKKIHKTGKIMKTLNPDWGPDKKSTFILSCPKDELLKGGLTFKMKDWDFIGSDDPLGHVALQGPELLEEKGEFRNFLITPPKGQEDEDAGMLTIRCRRATNADFDSLRKNERKNLFA